METDQDEQATSAGCESENMTVSTATEQITSEAIAEFNNMPQELHKAAKSAKFSESELQERRSFKDHDGSEIASTDTSLPTDDTVCFDEQQMGHLQNVGNLAEPIRKDSVDKDGHRHDDRLVVLTDVFDAANAALRAMEEEISEKTKELSIQETSIEYKENENLSEKTAGFPDECVSEYDLNNADSLEAVLKTDQIISEEITRRAQEEFEAKNRRTGRTYPMPTQNILDEVVYFQDSTTINPNTTAQQQAPGIEEYHVDRAENGRPNVRSEENSEGAVIKTEEPRMDIVSTEQVSMQNNPQENTGNRSTTVTEMNSMNITQPYEVTNIASGNKNGMNLQDEDASAQAQKTFSSATMAAEECSNLDEEQSQMEQTERQAEITGTELECEHDELLVCQSTSNPRESDDGEGHSITSVAELEQADSAVAEIATKSEADMSFGDEVSSKEAIFEKTTMQTQQSVQTAICEDKSNGKRMLEGEHEEALKRMSDENIETLFDSYFADHGCIKMMVATMREKGVGDEILTNNGEHIIEYGEQSSHLLKKSAELGSTPASELTMHSMSHHFDEVNHSGEVTAEELEYREETCNTDNLPVSSNEMESIANTAAVRSETFPQHETFAEPEFESDLMNCEQVNTEKSSCMSPSADCREDMTLATQNAPYGMPPDFNGTETDDVGVEHIGNDGSKELDRHPKHNEFPLLQPMLDEQQGHQEESVDDDIRRQDNNMRQEEHITRKEEGGQQLTHDQSIFAESTTEQNITPQEVPVPYVGEADGRHEHEQPIFPQPTAEQGILTPQSLLYPEHVDEQLKHEQSTMAQPTAEQGIVPQEQPLAHTEEQLTSPQAMIQEDIIPQDQRLPHVEEEDEQMRHDQATIPKPTTEQDMRPREKPTFCPGEGNEQIKREQPTFAQRTAERDVILQEQPPLYREEEDEHSERGNEQLNHEQPTMAQSTAEQGIIPQEQPLAHTEEQLTSPQAMIQEDIIPQDQPLPHVEEEDEQMRQDQATIPKPTTEQDMRPREKPTFCPGEGNEQIKREQPTFAQRTAERDVILQEQPPLYREEEDEHSERGNEQLNHEQPTMAQSTAEQGIIPQEQPLAHTEEQLTSPQAMIQEDIIPQDQPLPHVEEEDEQMRQDQATIPKPTTEQDMRPQEKPTFCPGEGNEQIKREQPTFAQRTAERDVILQEQPPLYREEEDEHSERGNEQLKHEQPTFAQSMAEQGIIPQEKPLDHTEQQLASPQGTALQGNILPSVQPLPYSDERNEQLTYDQATSSLPAAQQDIMPQPMYCPAGRDEQLEHEQPMLPQLQEDIVPKEQHLPYSEEGEEHLKHDQSIFPQADEDEQHVHQDEGGDNGMKWVDIVPQTLPMRYKGEEEMTALHGVAQKAQYPIEEHTEVEGQNKSDEHESEQRSFRLSYLSSMKPNTNANVLQWESDAFLMDEKKLLSEVERKNEIGEDPSARKQWHYDGSENLEETDEKEAHFEQRASEFGEDRLVTEKPASVVSQVKPIEDENPSSRPQSQLETTGDVSDIKATENHRREEVVEKKRDITPDSLNQSPHVDVRKRTDVVESGKDKNKLREHVPSRREKSDVSGARVPTGAKQLISNKKQNERATMGEALSKTHDQKEMRMSNLVKKQRATAMSNSAVNSSETSSHKVEKPLPRTSLEKIPASKVRQRAADNSKRTPTAYVRTSMKPPVPRKPQRKSGSVENKDAKGSFIAGTGSPEIKAEKVGEKSGGSECKSVKKTPVKVSICEPIVWVETFVPTFEAVWVALLPQDDDIMGAMKNSNECIGPTTRSEVNGIKKAHTATTPETTQKTSGCLQEALRNESISQEEMKFPAVPEESELAIEQIGEGDVLIVSSKETVEVSEEPSSSQHDVISAQESEAIEDSDRTIGRNLTIEAGEKDGKSEGTFPVDKTFFSPKASPHSRAPLESVSRGTSSNSEAPFESSLIAEPHHKDLGSAPIVNDSAELPPQLKDFQSNTSHSAMVDRFVEERSKQILLGNITASNESAGQNTLTEEVNGNIETALSEHYPETLTSTHNRCSEEGISDRRSSGENDGLTTKEEEVAMNAIAIATEAEQLQNEKEKEAINDEKSEEKPSRPRQHGRGQFRGTMMCEQEDWKQSNGRQDSKQKPLQTVEGDGYVNHSQQSSQHKSKKRSRRSGKEKGEICLE
uniref:Uncharacterized protein n=1 Tax=Parascaris univalens TaxID=6257 RepID=A0A915ADY0_PARUN